jgi:hypothetical protein
MQPLAEGAVATKKLTVKPTARFDDRMAAKLERRSRSIGAPVDKAAIDRILETIDLAGKKAFLIPDPGAVKVGVADAAKVKYFCWGEQIRSDLGFLTAVMRRRKLNTRQAIKKTENIAKKMSEIKTVLKTDPAYEAALLLAEEALVRLQENTYDANTYTNERIAGGYLPKSYQHIFGVKATMTRSKEGISEAIRFIQAFLRELGISYEVESIISAMQASKKTKRKR